MLSQANKYYPFTIIFILLIPSFMSGCHNQPTKVVFGQSGNYGALQLSFNSEKGLVAGYLAKQNIYFWGKEKQNFNGVIKGVYTIKTRKPHPANYEEFDGELSFSKTNQLLQANLVLFTTPEAFQKHFPLIKASEEVPVPGITGYYGFDNGPTLVLDFCSASEDVLGKFEIKKESKDETGQKQRCVFYLTGIKINNKYQIDTWYSGYKQKIKGELFCFLKFAQLCANLKLSRPPENHPELFAFNLTDGNYFPQNRISVVQVLLPALKVTKYHSFMGVSLGSSPEKTIAFLGNPTSVSTKEELTYYNFGKIEVGFIKEKCVIISTGLPGHKLEGFQVDDLGDNLEDDYYWGPSSNFLQISGASFCSFWSNRNLFARIHRYSIRELGIYDSNFFGDKSPDIPSL